jgi:ATP-binding cassette subfamily B protein
VLQDGEMVEEGTHETLIAKEGAYKELYEKQMQVEEVS